MKQPQNLKARLISSVLVLVMLFTSLLGTTFAWFTDHAISKGNTIISGSLQVDLLHKVENDWVSIKENPNHKIFDYNRWEPGYTRHETLKIANLGNLALQYKLSIEATGKAVVGPHGENLADVIDVYIVDGDNTSKSNWTYKGTLSQVMSAPGNFINGQLPPKDESLGNSGERIVSVILSMQENAGNEYMNLSVGDIYVTLVATQWSYEEDSFSPDYDKDSVFPELNLGGISVSVNTNNNVVTDAATVTGEGVAAEIPVGVVVNNGVNKLNLSVTEKEESDANLTLNDGEALRSLDVHMSGVSKNNTVPMLITVEKAMKAGLNIGNYTLYHVENNISVPMTAVDSLADLDTHNEFYYDPATGDVTLAMATFSEVALVADVENAWEGNFDYSWYTNAVAPVDGESVTEYTIANADQLAAFGAIVGGMAEGIEQDSFSGKTVKLIADINLGDEESKNNPDLIFYPIGYWNNEGTYERKPLEERTTAVESGFYSFCGTFDGNGHTIDNFYQNTWEMKGDHNWYDPIKDQYYRDGMGLFGKIYGGTVKNLTVKNFSSDGEIATTGTIAAYADGATFENIAIFNCNPRVYNIGNGGIVGCVGWYAKEANLTTTFKNITVDNSNKISALWGSYDVACGGIVGQYYPTSGQSSEDYPVNGGIHFENCHISAQMDVYNDVCANYQYYAYRYSGMLIGSVRENETIDGHSYPKMDGITAEGCTVHFGTWNDYYYCEIIDNTTASYTHDYQMSRLTEIKAIDGTTITYLDGTTGTVPASGRANYVIVDYSKGHGTENAICYHFKDGKVWNHADGGTETINGVEVLKEDKQHIYLEFNNLVTGYGWGVTSKGLTDFKGVENMDITEGDHEKSVVKFEGKVNEVVNNKTYKLGDIFNFVDNPVKLIPGALTVSIANKDENNPVSATIVYDRENWENGTITLTGTGEITITIQDYYFCTPTTITVKVIDRQSEEKFDIVMNNGDFLHRVGNSGTVALDKLFKAKDGVTVGTVSVTVEAVDGTGASGTYSNNAIQFNGTGVVKVTITDNDYCTPTELYLEVVDAVNATSATDATSNNVVLLNDCGFGSLEVSGGYTLYGNGFTMTCGSDSVAIDRTYSFVELKGGTLDNVKIVVPNFSHAIMYEKNKTESGNPSNTDSSGRTRYNNIRSAVLVSSTSTITNSYISGGRAAIYLTSGELTVKNSTIYGGAVANIQTEASSRLILEDVTLIQEPIKANVNDTSKTVMGLSVVMMCDTTGNGSPVTLKGYLHQYAWAHEGYTKYVPSDGQSAISAVLSKTDFIHKITYSDGVTRDSVNLGFAYMPDGTTATNAENMVDNRSTSEKNKYPYEATRVANVATIYTYKNTSGTDSAVQTKPTYTSTTQGIVIPNVSYSDTNANRVLTTSYDTTKAMWKSTLKVDVDAGAYTFSFAKLIAQKYGKDLDYTIKTENETIVDKNATITLDSAISNVYYLTITDDQIYDKNGNLTGETVEITYIFELQSTKTSLPAPTWTSTTLNGTPYIVVDSKDGDWNCAVPVLDGLKIKYWSKKQNKEVELDLSTIVSAAGLSAGLQNGSNNTITITVADEYTLTITTTGFKTNDNGKPVVVGGKLYFTVSSSSNYVSKNTTSRTPNISYTFTDANNSEPITLATSFNVVYSDHKSTQYKYSDFCNGKLTAASSSCVTGDTLVTLADGTQVRVDALTGNEMLLVWNHQTGALESVPVAYIVDHDGVVSEREIVHLNFSNGKTVKMIEEHVFFDATLNKYVAITSENADEFIGHKFAAIDADGDALEMVELISINREIKETTVYEVVSYQHLTCFTEGILSTSAYLNPLLNVFDINEDTLAYDAELVQKDIETYGLYTYADFEGLISEEAFELYNAAYLKIAVGKGYITWNDILDLIDIYFNVGVNPLGE